MISSTNSRGTHKHTHHHKHTRTNTNTLTKQIYGKIRCLMEQEINQKNEMVHFAKERGSMPTEKVQERGEKWNSNGTRKRREEKWSRRQPPIAHTYVTTQTNKRASWWQTKPSYNTRHCCRAAASEVEGEGVGNNGLVRKNPRSQGSRHTREYAKTV